MKVIVFLLISTSIYANCLDKYKESYSSKMDKYSEAMKSYKTNKSRALFSRNIIVSSIGSKLEPPSKESIFEEEILRSAGIGYDYITESVMNIHRELKPEHPFIELDMIKATFKEGLESGDFCKGIFGKYRIGKAKKYVIRKLKLKRDVAHSNEPRVINSDARVNKEERKPRTSDANRFIIQKR